MGGLTPHHIESRLEVLHFVVIALYKPKASKELFFIVS